MAADALFKKHFWLVGVAVVVACSALAATAVAHVVAATALAERADPLPPRPASRLVTPASAATLSLGQAGRALVTRNMFCSECVPDEPPVAPVTVADLDHPRATALPLRLVATNVSRVERRSLATIRNTTSAQQGAYRVGQTLPGAGPVRRITGKYVDFENRSTQRIERVALVTHRPPAPVPTLPPPAKDRRPPAPDPRAGRKALLAAVDAGVRKLDEDSFEVDRAVVAQLLANPSAAARGARIVPSAKDGRPNGFKMHAVRKNSVYAKIGFTSGDTIHAINGFELTSMDKALEVYTKVREASRLSVSLTRRGKPMTLDYTIR